MKDSVVIFGPAACGKTRNAKLIAEHLGLPYIHDGGPEGAPAKGALILSNVEEPGALDYFDVMREIKETL